MGLFSYCNKTSKRAIAVFNQMGITVSPNSTNRGLKFNSQLAVEHVRSQMREGKKIAFIYDNLVIYDQKAEETETNKNRSLQLTACAGYFLKLPDESPEEINSAVDTMLTLRKEVNHLRPTPTIEDVLDEGDKQHEYMDIDPSPLIQNQPSIQIALESKHLFRNVPDFEHVNTLDILSPDSVDKYYPAMVKGHLTSVLRKYCTEAIQQNPNCTLKGYEVPVIFQIPTNKSEIFTLPTLDLDESTIDGNAEIMEQLIREIGMKLEDMVNLTVPISGDQMTLIRMRTVKDLRMRDEPEHRADHVYPWMGFLHFGFAAADTVKRCNLGGKSGRDPASFTKLCGILGRTRVLDSKPDYNATHRLIVQIMEAHMLAAFVEIAGVKNLDALKTKVAVVNWVDIIDQVYAEFYPLAKVGNLRKSAHEAAQAIFDQREVLIRAKKPANRTLDEIAFLKQKTKFIRDEASKYRDRAFENALLYMQHSVMYYDFYTAMRKGDSGRLEKSLEFFTVLFEGIGKSNYAREMVEQQVDRKGRWTPYMRKVWLLNCLLNLSGQPGKFLGVDEVCEYLVRELKSTYNPRNTWQSKKFHMDTLSRLIMVFRDIKRCVHTTSGAPSYGKRHSAVDSHFDTVKIYDRLFTQEVMWFHKGRHMCGGADHQVRITESIDAWTVGRGRHGQQAPVGKVLRKRLKLPAQGKSSRENQIAEDLMGSYEDHDDGSDSDGGFRWNGDADSGVDDYDRDDRDDSEQYDDLDEQQYDGFKGLGSDFEGLGDDFEDLGESGERVNV